MTEPTEWCAGMVVVPKKTGQVRICVDLKPLVVVQDHPDSAFLDTSSKDDKSVWISKVSINGKEIPFKLDTGAEVTAISKET